MSDSVCRTTIRSVSQLDAERAELEAVLHSGIFGRAPNLLQFLQYVCQKYFEGEADKIKEYNIAVEALGRPPDFDQKKDSIVRVEAYRLRKRLREYYEGEAASHAIQIDLPSGQYAPVFLHRSSQTEPDTALVEPEALAELAVASVTHQPVVEILTAPSLNRRWWFTGVGVALAVLALLGLFLWRREAAAKAETPTTSSIVSSPAALPQGQPIRISAGSNNRQYTDRLGRVWVSDRFYNGGTAAATQSVSIQRTPDPALYRTQRQGDFRYDIPLPPGSYELHLYFAETVYGEGNWAGGGEAARIFHIFANEQPILADFDAYAEAGPGNVATEKVFKDLHPASDGFLHLHFAPGKDVAFVNGIEVLPGRAGASLPIRIVAREHSVVDSQNQQWEADRYVTGGIHVLRRENVSGSPDPDLFHGERYGHFVYSIPVAKSRYTVKLKFSEQWFGPHLIGGGGAGSRVFHVYFNGLYLLRDFDIYKEAGAEMRPIERVFHHLEPNSQGKLVLTFEPVKNYACINAIEVIDEGSLNTSSLPLRPGS